MRLILDTNIWISFLISKDFDWFDSLLQSNSINLLFSHELLTEFIAVASRGKIKKYLKPHHLDRIIDYFEAYGVLVHTTSTVKRCKDPDDDFLLELAIDGDADYLITGDKDLLEIRTINECKIIALAEFKNKLTAF